jgi:hypothetical protein
VTVRAIVGLGALNTLVLCVGIAAIAGVRGFASRIELVRLAGFAYLVGVALVGVVLSLELVLGAPFSLGSVVATCAILIVACLLLRSPLARWRSALPVVRTRGIGLVGTAFGLLLIVYLEALFRAARLPGLSAWDAWAFWVPKAKAIYFFGGLDEQFFRELVNPTYPPLVPALQASAFEFMGSPDQVTLHLQYWFFACGFVAAVAGLVAPRVPGLLLWPALLLVLVSPRVVSRTLDPQADFLLDYFFALAALLVVLWLIERQPWQLACASLFLGAAMLTKREGQLFAACVVGAALVASWRELRWAWPRLVLGGACAAALALPWRFWFSSRDLEGEFPQAGVLGLLDHLDRPWPALRSVLGTAADYDLWLLVLPVVAFAILLALVAGARILPIYGFLLYGLMLLGFTWVLWAFVELELPFVQDEGVNPVVRLTGSLVIVSGALLPLLLDAAWHGRDGAWLDED